MTDAQDRLQLLWIAGRDPDAVELGVEHFHSLYPSIRDDPTLGPMTAETEAGLRATGTMTGELVRSVNRLVERNAEAPWVNELTQAVGGVVVGAVRGGEVSAATLRFPDQSHLLLVDHGMAAVTWLAASMVAIIGRDRRDGVSHGDSGEEAHGEACAFRLALSRAAAGGSASLLPPMALSLDELRVAGAFALEMDAFVVAHEVAHILLGHLNAGATAVGIVGGSNRLMGKQEQQELAADELALWLMFADAGTNAVTDQVATIRLGAVRLFLTVLEEYEQSCFVRLPSSHPPAGVRWQSLRDKQLVEWFPDVDDRVSAVEPFLKALGNLAGTPRSEDPYIVDDRLRDRLDARLWSVDKWAQVGQVARMLCTTVVDAERVLDAWGRRHPEFDARVFAANTTAVLLGLPAVHALVREAIEHGRAISRLEATTALLSCDPVREVTAMHPRDPFPAWTMSVVAQEALAATLRDGNGLTS